jgi:hypothetical protein
MADDNIISIDGRRQAEQVRKDQATLEKREELLREKLKRSGLALVPEMKLKLGVPPIAPGKYAAEKVPGRYRIADTRPPQSKRLKAWHDLSLEQVEEATAGIDGSRNLRGYADSVLRPVTVGKPWRQKLPQCHLNIIDHLNEYDDGLDLMCAHLKCFREQMTALPEREAYRSEVKQRSSF